MIKSDKERKILKAIEILNNDKLSLYCQIHNITQVRLDDKDDFVRDIFIKIIATNNKDLEITLYISLVSKYITISRKKEHLYTTVDVTLKKPLYIQLLNSFKNALKKDSLVYDNLKTALRKEYLYTAEYYEKFLESNINIEDLMGAGNE